MTIGAIRRRRGNPSAADLEAALARLAVAGKGELRSLWVQTFGSDPPSCLTKDLMQRAIAYRVQEQVLGGLSPQARRVLRSYGKHGGEGQRPIKTGSLLVREHAGVLHEVRVMPGGFSWQGQTFASLSTIAKAITGTSWNGPRFFGLRGRGETPDQIGSGSPHAAKLRAGRPRRTNSPQHRTHRAGEAARAP